MSRLPLKSITTAPVDGTVIQVRVAPALASFPKRGDPMFNWFRASFHQDAPSEDHPWKVYGSGHKPDTWWPDGFFDKWRPE